MRISDWSSYVCSSDLRSLPDFRAHPRAGTGSAELRHSGLCLSRIRNFVGAPGERGAPPSQPPFATDVGLGRPDRNARPPLHKFQVEIVGKLLGDQLAGISNEDEPAEIGNDENGREQ